MNDDNRLPEPFEEVRRLWRERDLPMLLAEDKARDEAVAAYERDRLAWANRRWSVADEG